MKIGELAKRAGVSVDTVRYYEKAVLLPAPAREAKRRLAGGETVSVQMPEHGKNARPSNWPRSLKPATSVNGKAWTV